MRSALAAAVLALAAAPALAQTAAPAYTPPGYAPTAPMSSAAPSAPGAPAATRPAPTPQMIAARRAMTQACAADRARLCASGAGASERPMVCMRQHMSELSSGCTQAIQSMRQARQAGPAGPAMSGAPVPYSTPQ